MTATLIPYAWIVPTLERRPTPAINYPIVNQTNGVRATSTAASSITRYGYGSPQITLDTNCTADPGNLALWLTTYQSTPRPRQPTVRFNLIGRSEAEALIILSVTFGQWVQISGAPSTWPGGAANFTVQGIRHALGVETRIVEWQTSALVGTAATAPGPWFKWDTSSWDGTDVRPF